MEHRFEWAPLTAEDLSSYIKLVHAVGWASSIDPDGWEGAYHARQFRLFTRIGRLYGHRHEGRLISCMGIFPFGSEYAAVGMVMVDPHFQRLGLGQRLMRFLLEQENGKDTALFLIATALGEPLYIKFGFQTVEHVQRLELPARQGEVVASGDANRKITPFTEHDVATVIKLDQQVLGMDRSHFYRTLSQNQKDHLAFIIRDPTTNELEAFAFGIKRGPTLVIGPFVATKTADALQMLLHFRNNWSGPIRINIPEHQADFLHELQHLGATEIQVSPLMIRQATTLPGDRSRLFSIADPALG